MGEIEYHAVAKTDDLGEEEVMAVFVGEEEIALYNVDGEFYATHGVCTHENVGLADGFVEGDRIECPLCRPICSIPRAEDLRTTHEGKRAVEAC